MEESFLKQAQYYSNLGLDVFCVGPIINSFNSDDNNLLKSPNHDRYRTQSIDYLKTLDWDSATGLCVGLGRNNICAIDIDGCTDLKVVYDICRILGIPKDYSWIIKSGSHEGYHILLRCTNADEVIHNESGHIKLRHNSEKEEPFPNKDTNAYYPNQWERVFHKLEFKWQGNLVLPNSLHISGRNYEFVNSKPDMPPSHVYFYRLLAVRNMFGSVQAVSSEYSTRQFIARSDEEPMNFSTRIIEPYILVQLNSIGINPSDLTKSQRGTALNQISWIVLDKNHNVLKRKVYNYFTKGGTAKGLPAAVSLCKASYLACNKRNALFEFLFDLGHACRIITDNIETINCIKSELLNAGLYLDDFQTKFTRSVNMLDEIGGEGPGPDKEIISLASYADGIKLSVHELYNKFLSGQKIDVSYSCISNDEIIHCLARAQEMIIDNREA